ncbi:hypothetical protein [Acidisphaera sp. L21]|uniref:hypothetical protein n=1 Tax=Acidisphaera sp. L21 TaxID=1641851 RepID=UPI00131D9399|nr:hypothetical protein [Acidisphaera sp. L21]
MQELLVWLPGDRSWMPATGPYATIIAEMLDDGTVLIEEDHMPDDGDGQWRVRLTEAAVKILA